MSADGQKLLQAKPGDKFLLTGADGKAEEGKGDLDLSGLRMKVDPAAEWRQIFREAWRFQRDFFYVENVHGLDLDWAYRAYAPWVEHVRHRADLTYVLDILGGETCIGHSFTGGGDEPEVETVPSVCWAATSRWRTAATACAGSTRARTGTRSCGRP